MSDKMTFCLLLFLGVESREIDSNNTGKAEKIANIEFKTMFKTA